jgi:hypothetical protein
MNQKVSRIPEEEGSWVIWDYHVIAVVRFGNDEWKVWDEDSKIGRSEGVDLQGDRFCKDLLNVS